MENITQQENINLHLIYTPFTGVGLHGGYRGDEWFSNRIDVFKNNTLKSLLNQTSKNFVHWISFRPEERGHPLVVELAKYLDSFDSYKYIFTFNGLMYHDDKFTNYTLKTRFKNFLQMYHDNLKQNPFKLLKLVWENKNKTLVPRIYSSLIDIAKYIGTNYKWIYLTRIDSDDMLASDAVDLIQKQNPEWKRALVFKNGYIYNCKTGQVAEWLPPTNPPFHTIIFPASTFFDSQAHYEYYDDFKSHEDTTRVFNPIVLPDYKYMVAYHGRGHISTAWESPVIKKIHHRIKYKRINPFIGKILSSEIKKDFGIWGQKIV
ncbi:hypothetical protein M0R04_10880 [Candidatus Dojkabacteria bacterium]|jgi:hypothetical protein|nr:hypothetical protein [Candidatus Dojkabacteria bacterium]